MIGRILSEIVSKYADGKDELHPPGWVSAGVRPIGAVISVRPCGAQRSLTPHRSVRPKIGDPPMDRGQSSPGINATYWRAVARSPRLGDACDPCGLGLDPVRQRR